MRASEQTNNPVAFTHHAESTESKKCHVPYIGSIVFVILHDDQSISATPRRERFVPVEVA
jgi:hypothetical protein